MPGQTRLVGVVLAALRCWAGVAGFGGAAGGCGAGRGVAMSPGKGDRQFVVGGEGTVPGDGGLVPELHGCKELPTCWATPVRRGREEDLGGIAPFREIR